MTDLSELEKLARAATPGPWTFGFDDLEDGVFASAEEMGNIVCLTPMPKALRSCEAWPANAAYIAAANPATILALIAERDALRAGLEPFALAADNMDGDEPDALFIYDSPESTLISYADLRRARQLLTPRSETPDNLMEGEK